MYALFPLKGRPNAEFLNFLLLISPYSASETMSENISEYSTVMKTASHLHKCQMVERINIKGHPIEKYMKYYPGTLIRKKDLKVNAKVCNKFMFLNTDREDVQTQNFMKYSGYTENFSFSKHVNEFYFDTFDNVSMKVDEVITISIFKLKGPKKEDHASADLNISVDDKFQGKKIFEEAPRKENEEEKHGEQDSSTAPKIYVVELRGYCNMVDLETFSEEIYNFSKQFSPYVQFRKSTL